MSLCAAERFHSDASLEAVDRRAPNNSKNWQWMMEGNVSTWILTLAPHLNSNRYVREVLQPEVFPFFQGIPKAIFQQDNARPHVIQTVRDFCSAQHMQLLPVPAYFSDMSHIEHVWDLVDRRLARDPCPAASKDELLLRIQAIWNSLPQADIQNLFFLQTDHLIGTSAHTPQCPIVTTATAGSDVVQSGRPIFDDFFQHLWPYIGNNTANVVFQMVKRLWLIRIDQ
ncbi:hypothetical protein TNCV_3145951 [Trichonephila clavipes]|nr:hypothetical protein TNCV_3145951 [Trichonephila clavipes]